jgi:hypothetical protein
VKNMSESDPQAMKNVFDNLRPEYESQVEKEGLQGYSDQPWNLGRVADILWRHAPNSRALIKSHVDREFESALDSDSMPLAISDRLLLMEYWSRVIKPMLEAPIVDGAKICQEMTFLVYVTPFEGPGDSKYVTNLFYDEISSKLAIEPYWEIFSKACPQLSNRIT